MRNVLVLLSCLLSLPALAEPAPDRVLALVNQSHQPIVEVHVSSSQSEQWVERRFGTFLVSKHAIVLHLGSGPECVLNVQVGYATGEVEEMREVNVCRVKQLAFDGSRADGQATKQIRSATVINHAARPIVQVFASSSRSEDWGADQLPEDQLAPGKQAQVFGGDS